MSFEFTTCSFFSQIFLIPCFHKKNKGKTGLIVVIFNRKSAFMEDLAFPFDGRPGRGRGLRFGPGESQGGAPGSPLASALGEPRASG